MNGTDPATLGKGPGRDARSFMPGEGEVVYLAGHRTTYLAPFATSTGCARARSHPSRDAHAIFTYEVTGHRIVDDRDLSVLRAPGRELLRLQACHPRFFATQRYVLSARPVAVRR